MLDSKDNNINFKPQIKFQRSKDRGGEDDTARAEPMIIIKYKRNNNNTKESSLQSESNTPQKRNPSTLNANKK